MPPFSIRQSFIALGMLVLLTTGLTALRAARTEKGDRALTLPKWEDGSATGVLDSGLWPDDFNGALIVHPATLSPGQSDSESEQAEDDSWLRFLPRGLFGNRK